jgi:hypothetical protein
VNEGMSKDGPGQHGRRPMQASECGSERGPAKVSEYGWGTPTVTKSKGRLIRTRAGQASTNEGRRQRTASKNESRGGVFGKPLNLPSTSTLTLDRSTTQDTAPTTHGDVTATPPHVSNQPPPTSLNFASHDY